MKWKCKNSIAALNQLYVIKTDGAAYLLLGV